MIKLPCKLSPTVHIFNYWGMEIAYNFFNGVEIRISPIFKEFLNGCEHENDWLFLESKFGITLVQRFIAKLEDYYPYLFLQETGTFVSEICRPTLFRLQLECNSISSAHMENAYLSEEFVKHFVTDAVCPGELILNGIESSEHLDFAVRAITYVRTFWPTFIKISLLCNDLSLLNAYCNYFTKNNVLIRCPATNANLLLYADNPDQHNQCFFQFTLTNENFSELPVIANQIFYHKFQSRSIIIVNDILKPAAYNSVKKCCLFQPGFIAFIKLATSDFLTWDTQGVINADSQVERSHRLDETKDVHQGYENPIHFRFSSYKQNYSEYNKRMNAVNFLKQNAFDEFYSKNILYIMGLNKV